MTSDQLLTWRRDVQRASERIAALRQPLPGYGENQDTDYLRGRLDEATKALEKITAGDTIGLLIGRAAISESQS